MQQYSSFWMSYIYSYTHSICNKNHSLSSTCYLLIIEFKYMEGFHQTLDQIQKGKQKVLEETKLELKLGPPGETITNLSSHKRGFQETEQANANANGGELNQENKNIILIQESSHPCNFTTERNTSTSTNPLHKRISPNPVVGWPPVRSSRKNITITNNDSTKMVASETWLKKQNTEMNEKKEKNGEDNLFVKINMDGIPIGRKIDLKAYDSYAKLSLAIDPLFNALLAGQDAIKLGEFSLVYEDNEGDRMLVGDVPWQMFISSAKRLRVLKISQLSTLSTYKGKLEKVSLNSATKDPTVSMIN